MVRHSAPSWGIWGLAFGYFAAYVPYSALTKAISSGLLPGMERAVPGLELLPTTVFASMVGMFAFLTAKGWWKHAAHGTLFGMRLPRPSRWTLLSGLATATVVATTTLAYTFSGTSIVFMMLLMRGGVLVIAPLVDLVSKRKVRWFSWVALALSLSALVVSFTERMGFLISLVAAIDVALYLASYFVRLRFMSRLAKSENGASNVRFFVEEQMVATPALFLFLCVMALIGANEPMLTIRAGFTTFFADSGVVLPALVVGLLSQGTGIFGGLILLDKRENTFCVPVNRSSSILAGVAASFTLTLWLGQRPPAVSELVGAALIVGAILFLTLPGLLEKRRAAAAAAAGGPTPGLSA